MMYRAGISYDRFGKLTKREINIISSAYADKIKADFETEDLMAYVQGVYFMEALKSTVGNMFGKNTYKYPEKPFAQANKPLTEKEKQEQIDLFISQLKTMEDNFNLSKAQKEKKNEQGKQKVEDKG